LNKCGGGGGGAIIYINDPQITNVTVGSGGMAGNGETCGTSYFGNYAYAFGGSINSGGTGVLNTGTIGIVGKGDSPFNYNYVDTIGAGCAFGLSPQTNLSDGAFPGGGGSAGGSAKKGANGCVWIFEY